VAAGLALMSSGFVVAAVTGATTPYVVVAMAAVIMGAGLGLTSSPATESIKGSLPPEKAGVGSAVNDTTREVGGTLGVAVLGSLLASLYGTRVAHGLAALPLPAQAKTTAGESVGAAFAVAQRVTVEAGPQAGAVVRRVASAAFMDGFHLGSWVAAGVAMAGALAALAFLPARAVSSGLARRETIVPEVAPTPEVAPQPELVA
jgi:hypothetical protein